LRNGVTGAGEDLPRLLDDLVAEIEAGHRRIERRLDRLAWNQQNLDARLVPIEYSRIFRSLRWLGAQLPNSRRRLGRLILHSPLHPVYLKLFPPVYGDPAYDLWIERERARSARESSDPLRRRPLISIVMPVCDPRRDWLEAAVHSVLAQTYPEWELCVSDDASREGWIAEYVRSLAARDQRVRFVRCESRQGIAGALNRAGALAAGEYVGFLDQDDTLAACALESVARAVEDGRPVLVYSDEAAASRVQARLGSRAAAVLDVPRPLAGGLARGPRSHGLVPHRVRWQPGLRSGVAPQR
jgi:hypothetical protein